MLVAFAANAATVSVSPGTATLQAAISAASAGDVLVLADGTYNESGNYIDFNKSLEVKAADGAHPVVNVYTYIKIQNSANVKIIGVKFDGTSQGNYSYFFRVYDNSENSLELEGCELCNNNNIFIRVESGKHINSIKINNCYFHNGNNNAIRCHKAASAPNTCDQLIVTNSTFANFAIPDYGCIEVENVGNSVTSDIETRIDHCTFYNITKPSNNTYGVIDSRKSTNNTITNCIFVNPETLPDGRYAARATQLYGGSVSNCLVFNTPNHRTDDITLTAPIADQDPLFADAANGDFTLTEGSPALGAATDGDNLGDPRWFPAVPSTATTVYLAPGMWNADGAKYAIYAYEPGKPEQWSDFLALAENETNIYTGTVPAGYSHLIFVRLDASAVTPNWGSKWNQTGNLTLIDGSANNLFTITAWDAGTWSAYVAPAAPLADGYYLVGNFGGEESWTVADLTAERKLTQNPENDAEWYIDFTLTVGDEFKVVSIVDNAIASWYPASPAGNYAIEADHAGTKTIYFKPAGEDHPELNNGWYYGKLYVKPNNHNATLSANWSTLCLPYATMELPTGVEAYSIASIAGGYVSLQSESAIGAGKAYLVKAAADGSYEFDLVGGKVNDPVVVNNFVGNLAAEAAHLAVNGDNDYFILMDNEFHLLAEEATADVAQYKAYISLVKNPSPAPVLRIIANATNIEGIEGNETAVKFIQNGQLFIRKNGVVYDATGAVVR